MPVLIFVVVALVVLTAWLAFGFLLLRRLTRLDDERRGLYAKWKADAMKREPDPTPAPPSPSRP